MLTMMMEEEPVKGLLQHSRTSYCVRMKVHVVMYCLVAFTFLFQSTNSFAPLASRVGIRRCRLSTSTVQRTISRASVIQLSKSTASSDFTATDIEQRKQDAIDALEKLMDRQKAELSETETLLNQLQKLKPTDPKISNRAASVLSGVDYGFVSRSEGATFQSLSGGLANETLAKGSVYEKYGPPANIVELGVQQFKRNLNAIKGEYKDEADVVLTPEQETLHALLDELTLNSTAIWERELAGGPIQAPWIIKLPYLILCGLLDTVFEGKYVPARFFLLETVARMPYFSYITMLHLYETLGFWRRSSDVKRIHFAEEWNEYHHLLIMESLGGDQKWWVRFMAQHSAIVYYIVLNFLWALSPTLAYKFSELLEGHAVNTYGQFIDENEELLKKLPPSKAAINYYTFGFADPLFGEYQTTALATGSDLRKPGDNMQSLYDVFKAIQADEGDHVGTMKACLDPDIAVQSPSLEQKVLYGAALVSAGVLATSTGYIDIPDVSFLKDVLDAGSDIAVDDTTVDIAAGVGAGFLSKFLEDDEQAGLAADAIEGGSLLFILETARKGIVDAVIWLARFLATLL